jgi:hypothetical protein
MQMAKFGFYSALSSAAASIGYTAVQILQLTGVVHYPVDAVLVYAFSLCIAPPFMLAMLALYHSVETEKKFWAHAALLFSVLYNTFVMLMYVVQLASVIPFHLTDEALIVTPHSFFWTTDALGYINMGIAAFFAAFVFKKRTSQRWLFLAHSLMTPLVAVVYFFPVFSVALLMLASPWSITAPGCMIALALSFKRDV